jgi:hypothetical protein
MFGDDQERVFAMYAAIVEQKVDDVAAGRLEPAPETFLQPSARATGIPTSYGAVQPDPLAKPGLLGRAVRTEGMNAASSHQSREVACGQ